MGNKKLTDNFWLEEFFVDSENKPQAAALFKKCTPCQEICAYDLALDQQEMRNFINEQIPGDGKIKITNTSGYRDPELNAAQNGSAAKSLHTMFRAVDFKTDDPDHLKKIYKYITMFSHLLFRECFVYVTTEGVATNIHYAKKAPGFTDRRYGIYVRVPGGVNPVRLDEYIASISDDEGAIFQGLLNLK